MENGDYFTLDGDKLYHERARKALPILVRQARAQQTIFYSHLAEEIGMNGPRPLSRVLGAIGESLVELKEEWGTDIPPIQTLVVNKQTGAPGAGIAGFLTGIKKDFKKCSPRLKQKVIDDALIKAELMSKQIPPNVKTLLVLEGEFPKELIGLKNVLGVEVIDNVNMN